MATLFARAVEAQIPPLALIRAKPLDSQSGLRADWPQQHRIAQMSAVASAA